MDTFTTLRPDEPRPLPWPAEAGLESDEPPQSDYDLSRNWRSIRHQEREIERLKAYLVSVTEAVRAEIGRRQERISFLRDQALLYLQDAGRSKIHLPDLGTVFLSTRTKVAIDEEVAFEWAGRARCELVTLRPVLDKDALKKHVLATGEVVPGVEVTEETSVAFRAR